MSSPNRRHATEELQREILAALLAISGIQALEIPSHDYASAAYPTAVQEVITYKTGGAGGVTVGTLTINYTDATKDFLSNYALVV